MREYEYYNELDRLLTSRLFGLSYSKFYRARIKLDKVFGDNRYLPGYEFAIELYSRLSEIEWVNPPKVKDCGDYYLFTWKNSSYELLVKTYQSHSLGGILSVHTSLYKRFGRDQGRPQSSTFHNPLEVMDEYMEILLPLLETTFGRNLG